MPLNTQSFTSLLSNTVTAIQGAAASLIDLSVGAVLRAITEAHVAIALWLQGIALQVAALTRFATSFGTDADSWGAQFVYPRLPAQPATGAVTFSRYTPTNQATIQAAVNIGTASAPIYSGGYTVQTQDGTRVYQVIPDTTQSAYNATLNAYVLLPSINSITATVQATVAGSASNAAALAINTLGSSISGVDSVSNALTFENGDDAESDSAYKARFPNYIASLSEGTPAAIEAAIDSVQQDVSSDLVENQTLGGIADPGYFYAVVDDGTGNPNSTFLNKVGSAIEAVRPIGSTYGVFGPTTVNAIVGMTITTSAGYLHSAVVTVVATALTNYINSLPIGAPLPFTILANIAYDASPGVINVTGISLNGLASDLIVTNAQVIKAGTIGVL